MAEVQQDQGPPPFNLWRVVDQQHTVEVSQGGRFDEGMRVTIETVSGAEGQFFVPMRSYTPERVAAEADALARKLEMVSNLQV